LAKDDIYWPLWLLALKTGLRRGELLGLRWNDLDLDAGTLRVQQTVLVLNGAPCIQQPKTDAGRRIVKLSADVVAALLAYRKAWAARQLAAPAWADADLVSVLKRAGARLLGRASSVATDRLILFSGGKIVS
jgi:integrase